MSTDLEEDYFWRNAMVIGRLGKNAFKRLLEKELSNPTLSLSDFISLNQHGIFHKYSSGSCCQCTGTIPKRSFRRVINDKQMEIMFNKSTHLPGHSPRNQTPFCCSVTNQNLDIDSLDVTLAHCLLLNFGTCYQSNSTYKSAAENIIEMRNAYAHNTDQRIPEAKYQQDQYRIQNNIRQMYPLAEHSTIQKEISEAYQRPMDKTLARMFHLKMVEELNYLEEARHDVKELLEAGQKTNETLQQLSGDQEDVKRDVQNLTKMIHSMQITIDDNRSNVGRRKIIKAKRKSKGSGIKNMIEQSKFLVQDHQSDDTYVVTSAVEKGLEILKKNKFLVIVSKSGGGKRKLSLEIASRLLKEGTVPIVFQKDEIIVKREIINPKENTLIIAKDFLENFSMNNDNHNIILDGIESWVKSNESQIKIVMTTSADASTLKPFFQTHSIFAQKGVVLNLDNEAALSIDEKKEILLKHARKHRIVVSDRMCNGFCNKSEDVNELCPCIITDIVTTDTFYGFPQSAHLYCSCPNLTKLGVKYFRNSSKSLVEEVQNMLERGLKGDIYSLYNYVFLSYMAIKGEMLKVRYQRKDSILQNATVVKIFQTFDQKTNLNATVLNRALEKLEGIFLTKVFLPSKQHGSGVRYAFQHKAIVDAFLISYGREYPDEVLKICDDTFIFNYVYPDVDSSCSFIFEMEENSCNFPAKVLIKAKKVEKRLLKLLDIGCYYHLTLDQIKLVNKAIVKFEKQSNEELSETDPRRCKAYFPAKPLSHIPQAVGKYLKDWYLFNDHTKSIANFFKQLETQNPKLFPDLTTYLLDGLTEDGMTNALLHKMPDLCKKYIPYFGSPSLLQGFVRPKSSETYLLQSSEYLLVDDEKMQNCILASLKMNDIRSAFRFGQYLSQIAIEGNRYFTFNLFSCLNDMETSKCVRLFIDGFFNHGHTLNDCKYKFPNLSSMIQKHGSLDALILYCRPNAFFKEDKQDFILIEPEALLQKIKIGAGWYFKLFSRSVEVSKFEDRIDLSLTEYGGKNFRSVACFDIENLLKQIHTFCVDVSDAKYSDQVIASILTAMRNSLDEETLNGYLHLFHGVFLGETDKYPLSHMILNTEKMEDAE